MGITVRELFKACRTQVEKGNGDKLVLVSADDEGNYYNTLYYLFQDDVEEIKEWNFDSCMNPEEIVLLG